MSPLPPLLPGAPLVGSAPALWRDPVAFLVDGHARHGPVFRCRLPGTRLVSMEEAVLAEHLRDQGESCLSRERFYRAFKAEVGVDLFSSSPDAQPELRRAFRLCFSAEVSRQFAGDIIRVVDDVIATWRPGARVRVDDALGEVVLRALCWVAADTDARPPVREIDRFARDVMGVVVGTRPGAVLATRGYRRARDEARGFVDRLATQHLRPSEPRTDRLTVLGVMEGAAAEFGSDRAGALCRAVVLSAFIGGLDYIRNTSAAMLYQALRNPSLGDSIRSEGDELLAQPEQLGSQLRGMQVTRGTYLECLRMTPALPGIPYWVERGFTAGGYFIEPGQILLATPLPGHFDARHYRDPHTFDASRFLPPRSEHRGKGVYSPFGIKAGKQTRSCAAQGMTSVLCTTIVATLLARIELELPSRSYRPTFRMRPTLAPPAAMFLQVGEPRCARAQTPSAPRDTVDLAAEHLTEVTSAVLAEQLATARPCHFESGQVILQQGDPADGFHVIVRGQVEVSAATDGGGTEHLATLGKGDHFGETGLLRNCPRTAMVTAAGGAPVDTLFLSRDAFLEIVALTDLFSDEIGSELHARYLEHHVAAALPALTGEQLAGILPEFEMRLIQPGTTIFRQGDPATCFHIICEGRVEVWKEHTSGETQLVAQLVAGDWYGETGILERQPRNATVKASADAPLRVLELSRDAFLRLVMTSQSSRNHIISVMHDRLVASLLRGE